MSKSNKLEQLQENMNNAENYQQWREVAAEHDELTGASRWRKTEQTRLYDYAQIRRRLEQLRNYRIKNDNMGLLFTLNEGVHGNMGGMGKMALYSRSQLGTKHLIEEYVEEIASALLHISTLDDSEIDFDERFDLFQRASLCYGRSALMLSGGGSLGHFHLGVLKALIEEDLMPSVLSGASAGSFVSGILGTRSKESMQEYFHSETLIKDAKEEAGWFNSFFRGDDKERIDIHDIEEAIKRLIPNLTFQEAYELTGYRINISVAPAELHQTSRLLNAITSPNVYVRSAVKASCAVPGVYPAVTLEAKNVHGEPQPYLPTRKWVDGSVSDDLPVKRLSRLYGVNHYIGSLINPIVMFANEDSVERGTISHLIRKIGHRSLTGCVKGVHNLTQKYAKDMSRANLVAGMVHSVFQQNYHADIAVFPDFKSFDMRKILQPLEGEELIKLIRQGELATWRKMDMIRTCSKISRVLDDILLEYDELEHHRYVRGRKHQAAKA